MENLLDDQKFRKMTALCLDQIARKERLVQQKENTQALIEFYKETRVRITSKCQG